MLGLIEFLQAPQVESRQTTFKLKLYNFIQAYLFIWIFIVVAALVLKPLDLLIKQQMGESILNGGIKTMTGIKSENSIAGWLPGWVLIVFIGPLIEEIIFRLYLIPKKSYLAISLSLLSFSLSGSILEMDFYDKTLYYRVLVSIIVFAFVYFLVKDNFLAKLQRQYFKVLFYTSCLIFGFIHISNFDLDNDALILIAPLFVLPQIIIGIALGYTRVKNQHGMLWSIALHCLVNSHSVLF